MGQFIGRKREQLGMSQGALAKKVGISRPYLSQIESGHRAPSDEVVQRILVMLGSPMQEFAAEVASTLLTADQLNALNALFAPVEDMAALIEPADLLRLTEQAGSLEQMTQHLSRLSLDPLPIGGPDGWLDLNAEDRRLVQRLVNRLRKTAPACEEDSDGDH
jgi:putative transcriptional regulator